MIGLDHFSQHRNQNLILFINYSKVDENLEVHRA